ncbi:hypothetical protein KC367_g429 [Hortaea werneckii]|uniref:General transcription and DNA repair factor IIH subunit TFB5 n=2 Tax=Hortaea werneckii TaxID=91943 RepID=A0A3M7GRZ7_HORWE|nr:hypothetical protein KC342_g7794 [Hortaea werneckii]OTA23232.1 hypothetical protein BTJ68_13180 [Hortaea werneckii EXF-2000]KAI6839280.1 hypothetical protein KC358_g4690 [Hortaea werneckii]KAI6842144.1 hypothetical protein KC358_g4096 [Hortaea werneckii]KAI6847815.1 hypothetical protein KC350_g3284 [Hortaea werneckii]
MPKARAGVLIECDPSIKAIIMKIDREQQHRIVMEEIDDEHVLIQNDKHDELKELLKNALKDTVREAEDSSESD